MVNENVPEQVGVPERYPTEGSVNPAGRLPLDTVKLYGPMPLFGVIVLL